MNKRYQISLYFLIFLIIISSVSAATKYWLGNGNKLIFHSAGTLVVDTANNRVGIGDSTPDYLLDMEGLFGTGAYFITSSGNAITIDATAYGIYGYNSQSTGRGIYGRATTSGAHGIYGRTSSSSGYSGYFTGGSGLYSDGNEVYATTNCRYVSASSSSVSCSSPEELVGGGCYCYCGSNRLRYSVPSTNMLTWQCSCADCTGTSYAICCG